MSHSAAVELFRSAGEDVHLRVHQRVSTAGYGDRDVDNISDNCQKLNQLLWRVFMSTAYPAERPHQLACRWRIFICFWHMDNVYCSCPGSNNSSRFHCLQTPSAAPPGVPGPVLTHHMITWHFTDNFFFLTVSAKGPNINKEWKWKPVNVSRSCWFSLIVYTMLWTHTCSFNRFLQFIWW